MADPKTGMSKGEMKSLLVKSKQEPVYCAIGLGDKGVGLMTLSKTRSGSGLEKTLKTDCPDAANMRHGTAFVDTDDNPTLVKLTLNKAVSGMAKRLAKTLKGTGFSKVVIVTEDGAVVESGEDVDDVPGATAGAAPADTANAGAASADTADAAADAPAARPTVEDKAAQASALAKQLAALMAQIPAAAAGDDARKAELVKLATMGSVNIKTGNLVYAATSIEQLRAALAGPGGEAAAGAVGAARDEWVRTQDKVRTDIAALRTAIAAAYAGAPQAGEIDGKFQTAVAPVLSHFDGRLTAALDGLIKEADAAKREQAVAGVRAVLKDTLSFAMADKLIGDLDANPFAPLAIRKAVTTSLAAVAKSVH